MERGGAHFIARYNPELLRSLRKCFQRSAYGMVTQSKLAVLGRRGISVPVTCYSFKTTFGFFSTAFTSPCVLLHISV